MNPNVDVYIHKLKKWQQEAAALQSILLATGLVEEFKWGRPCYTAEGKNTIAITPLKDHCALNFFNGAQLKDPKELLIIPGENAQSARWMKFISVADIHKKTKYIQLLAKEAMAIAALAPTGVKKTTPSIPLPNELLVQFKSNPNLKRAFHQLTPGRQRGYLIYFTGTKNAATMNTRIEKVVPKILCGKGLHDCTCGLSKKMPSCDGSHRFAKT